MLHLAVKSRLSIAASALFVKNRGNTNQLTKTGGAHNE